MVNPFTAFLVPAKRGYAPSSSVAVDFEAAALCLPGDVNGDGKVNTTDLTKLRDYLLGRRPAGFVAEAADLNQDGRIDIADLTLLIDSPLLP